MEAVTKNNNINVENNSILFKPKQKVQTTKRIWFFGKINIEFYEACNVDKNSNGNISLFFFF